MKTIKTTLIVLGTALVVAFIGYSGYRMYYNYKVNEADKQQEEQVSGYHDIIKKAATPTK